MKFDNVIFEDRYTAAGIDYPDPETVCKGQCEGMGTIPVYVRTAQQIIKDPSFITYESETNKVLLKLWEELEKISPTDDGYHFVKCPECKGTGKRSEGVED